MQSIRIEDWVYQQLSLGEHAFSLEKIKQAFAHLSVATIKRALARLSKKGKILSVHNGYYLIIDPQHQTKGILPPTLFINDLMKFLHRNYYVGLLSAAQIHGAAHHAPQEFYVFIKRPAMRPIEKKGVKVNFIGINTIHDDFLEERKTASGYIKISSPILTAIDLIDFDYTVGRISRVSTVLNELAESLKPEDFNKRLLEIAKIATLQRLGYILENIIEQPQLAASLYILLSESGTKLQRIKLHSQGKVENFPLDKKWQVIINATIEIDE
jgi:predicted transcriptional regulator of viral defense system